jgi:autotransporter-associated beta strand protein
LDFRKSATRVATGLALFAFATAAWAQSVPRTNWTGAGGDSRWDNPANWSDGVPDASTEATFFRDFTTATVDLGGVTRRAAAVRTGAGIGSRVRLVNGTLSTPVVDSGSGIEIDTTLTTDAPVLQLRSNPNFGLVVSGPIVGGMDVLGSGRLLGRNTYTGSTFVRGAMEFAGNGELIESPVVEVPRGARLVLNSNTWGAISRSQLVLRGGLVTAFQSDSARSILLESGQSTIIPYAEFGGLDSLRRLPGATLAVGGDITFWGGNMPPLSNNVAPWATVDWGSPAFATPNIDAWLFPLDDYAPGLLPGADALLLGGATRSGDVSVNTLTMQGANLALDGAELRLAGGGLLFRRGTRNTIGGTGRLALPDSEGFVHAFGAETQTIDVPVSGGILTFSGGGQLALSRANTYSGGTFISAGTLTTRRQGALGSGPVRFTGGGLKIENADAVVSNDLVLDTGHRTGDWTGLSVPASGTTTFSGVVSGSGAFVVSGGSVHFTGGGAREGDYEVRADGGVSVVLDGDFASPDAVFGSTNVGPGPTVYGGNGTIRGLFDGGIIRLSPGPLGNRPGRLTFGQAELDVNTIFQVDLAGPHPASEYDQLVVLERLSMVDRPGTLELLIDQAFRPSPGEQFTIIEDRFAGSVIGTFSGLAEGSTIQAQGTSFRISYVGGDGNDVVLTVVPEPGSVAAVSLVGLLLLRRRDRRSGPL